MAIALFGGSFDPPHKGHEAIVYSAIKALDIERLIIIPTYINPFKSGYKAPPELRLKWLREIFSDMHSVEVSDYEVLKRRPSYAIETVEHFANEGQKLYYIIGADNVASLHKWHNFEKLNNLVTWVVATRAPYKAPNDFITLHVDIPISSSRLRERPIKEYLHGSLKDAITQYYR